MPRVFEAPDGAPGPARIIDLYCGYMISKTLFAAVEFDLFTAAGPDPATPAGLAVRCRIPQCSARAMVDLLADAGLLVRLFRRLRAAAAPGATLLLVDWWRTDRAPHPSARFGAGEFLVISGGDLYQVDEVTGWLAETGWSCTGLTALPPPSGVLQATPI